MPDIWGLAAIGVKLALYVGILTAAGVVFAAVVFRLERVRGLVLGFGALGLVATAASFALRGAALTGDASGMTDPEMLGLLWSTPVGTALSYRLVGLSMLLTGVLFGRRGLYLATIGGLVAVRSFDHIGHIPDRDTWLLDAVLLAHLLTVAFWIGILTPLRRLALTPATFARCAEVSRRFGHVASVTVPALILAGGYMAVELTGSVAALTGTAYGLALVLKIVLVAGLLGLAALNKLRFVPGLERGAPDAAAALATTIRWEWTAVMLILGVTAVMTTTLTLPT